MVRILIGVLGLAVLALCVGCSRDSGATATTSADSQQSTVFNAEGAPTLVFDVPGMMCEDGCTVKVHEILSERPGVKEVEVDFPNRTATIAIDKSQFDSDAAVAALVDHGFENSKRVTTD